MKMKKKNLSLYITILLSGGTLSGCGSSDKSTPAPQTKAPTVISGKLCIDQNLNARCDTGETSSQDLTDNKIPTSVQSTTHPTIFEATSGGLLTASPTSTEISVFSSLVYNEVLFNPAINTSSTNATNYLTNLQITQELANAEQAKWLTSVGNAIAIDTATHPYKAIGAVINKIVTDKSKFDVSVSAEEIAAQRFVKQEVGLTENSVSWELSDHDERTDGVAILNGRNMVVAGTHYHNRLIVIDTSGNTPKTRSTKLFAAVDAARFAKDTVSGASEHKLRSIKSSADGRYVYVSVKPKGDVGNEFDTSYGLFRVAVSDAGIADNHDSANSKRYISKTVDKFFIAGDGKIFVEDPVMEDFIILNADLSETGERVTLPASIDVDSAYFSPDGNAIYLLAKGDSKANPVTFSKLHKFNRSTNAIEKEVSLTISDGIDNLVFFDEGKQALIYKEKAFARVVDLENMKVTKELPLSVEADQVIQTASVSPNGKYAVISGHHRNETWLFNLSAAEVRMEKLIPSSSRVRALSINNNGDIVAANSEGITLSKLTIGDVITPEKALALDKAYITRDNLNHGLSMDLIVSDLALFTEIPAGNHSTISWSTTNPAINVTATETEKLGAVTRDPSGDATGTLTATLDYRFRNIHLTDQISIDTKVRKAPQALPEQGVALEGGQFSEGYVSYIDVSPDGTRAVPVFRGYGGFNLVKRKTDNSPFYALTTTPTSDTKGLKGQQLPGIYAYQVVDGKVVNESRPVGTQFINNDYVIIATPGAKDAADMTYPGALLVYKVDDLSIADGEADLVGTATTNQFGGTIKSLSHLVNGHVAIVVEVTANDQTTSRKAVIINVANPEALVVVMDNIKVADTASAIEVSGNAQSVYVAIDGAVAQYNQAGNGTPLSQTPAIEGFSARSIALGGTNYDTLFIGTGSGVAKIHQYKSNDLSQEQAPAFNTGYFARVQTLDVINKTAYASIWGIGVTVIDTINQQELSLFAHGRQRRAGISSDGQWLYAAQYISRSTNQIRVLRSPE